VSKELVTHFWVFENAETSSELIKVNFHVFYIIQHVFEPSFVHNIVLVFINNLWPLFCLFSLHLPHRLSFHLKTLRQFLSKFLWLFLSLGWRKNQIFLHRKDLLFPYHQRLGIKVTASEFLNAFEVEIRFFYSNNFLFLL
jgi:hypothetical protein